MISLLRNFVKSWMFTALMGLLILSFAIFGMGDSLIGIGKSHVVEAGSRNVTPSEFKLTYDRWRQGYTQQTGQQVSVEDFVSSGNHVAMLQELAGSAALNAWLDKAGVRASARMIVDQINKVPQFFNPVTGKFDREAYLQTLSENGMDDKFYERMLGDEIAVSQYASAAGAALHTPRVAVALQSALSLQTRDVSLFVLSPRNVPQPAAPTDAEIKTYYDSHKEELKTEEVRQVRLISFAPEAFMAGITPDDAELRRMYDFQRDALSTPETRSFVTILTSKSEDAAAISAALRAGKTPEAAAASNKGQVVAYDRKPKTAVSDAKVAAAAFGMGKGEISGPVEAGLGYAVIRMDSMTPGSTPAFEAVRTQLAESYVREQAANKVHEVATAFSDAHNRGEAFEATAQRLGLKINDLPPMTADGKTGNPQVNFSQYPAVLHMAFDLPEGGESDVEELSAGQSFALKVVKVAPARYPTLDEVKPYLVQRITQERWVDAVNARAEEAASRLAGGETLDQVAAAMGSKVESVKGIDRDRGAQAMGPALSGRIFTTQAGKTFNVDGNNGAVAIGRVDAIHQGDAAIANQAGPSVQGQLSASLNRDINDLVLANARKVVKVKTNPDLAARTLGVDPQVTQAAQSSQAPAQ